MHEACAVDCSLLLVSQPVPRIGKFKLTDSNLKTGHESESKQEGVSQGAQRVRKGRGK